MITSALTLGGSGYAMIEKIETIAEENRIELAKRESIIHQIPRIYENQIIICTALDVNCK